MRRNQGWTGLWQRKQYLIAGLLVAGAVAGMSALYSREQAAERMRQEQEFAAEQQSTEQVAAAEENTTAQEAASVLKPEQREEAAVEPKTEAEAVETEEQEPKEETQTVTAASGELHFDADTGLMWPMEGNVILDYSMDSTVYFATLDQYKYNPAVIIAGDVNSKVYSVARGKVKEISNNEETGCTVTVDLGDGYEAVYGQLKEPNFAVGDYVEAGHVLGYVSEPTKYYSVEGSNLYFELKKDGQPIDPVTFFE